MEIDGPSDSVAFFCPQILVQNAVYPEKYTKIADATLTISTTNPDDAGEYEFAYTMEDTMNRFKETIHVTVEIIAPEELTWKNSEGPSSGSFGSKSESVVSSEGGSGETDVFN